MDTAPPIKQGTEVNASHGRDLIGELREGWAPLPNSVILSLVLAGLRVRLSRSVVTMVTVVLAIAFLAYTGLTAKLTRNLVMHAIELTQAPAVERGQVLAAIEAATALDPAEGIQQEPLSWISVWLPRPADEVQQIFEAREKLPAVTQQELDVLRQEIDLRLWVDSPRRRELAEQYRELALDYFRAQAARLLPAFRNSSAWSSAQFAQAGFLVQALQNHPQAPEPVATLAAVFQRENDSRSGTSLTTTLLRSGINPDTPPEGGFADAWIITMALLLCTVGIANAMLMSVTERFREIGTMKCLGAPDGLVVKLFLLESAFLGVSGATLGIVLGIVVVLLGGLLQFGTFALLAFPLAQGLDVMAYALLAGILLAVAGTAYPAILAARMNPVDALRVEE